MPTRDYAYNIFHLLEKHYPHAKMIMQWGNNFELLVAIILSAQCTDKKVNEVTSVIFPKYKNERPELENKYHDYSRMLIAKNGESSSSETSAESRSSRLRSNNKDSGQARMTHEELVQLVNLAFVPIAELEQDIKPTGFYHNKAKSVQHAAQTVLDKFSGMLPKTIEEMTTIPGVGRKTANVFLGNAYHIYEGIAVDTHVTKQSQALGLTHEKTPEKIEQDLMKLFDKKDWYKLTYMLIEHGRNVRRKRSDRIVCNDPNCLLCKQK